MPQEVRPSAGKIHLLLALIVVLAAILRFADLGNAPPGLQQDEACNAWNAYCLLKTGKDQAGVSWPLLYSQGLGENRSTLFFYWTIPFQFIGGMNIWTTRAPAAFAGVLTVLLLYYVAARLFDRRIGLLAAAFLALCPWHIQHTRWGHESSLAPLAVAAALAAALAARLPLTGTARRTVAGPDSLPSPPLPPPGSSESPAADAAALARNLGASPQPRVLLAAVAGLVTAVACYGYPSIRLYVPVLILASIALTLPNWWAALHTRRGAAAIAAYAGVGLLVFAPLLVAHLTHPEEIARRAEQWVWRPEDGVLARVLAVGQRYFAHFSMDFLYLRGDGFEPVASPTGAYLTWYALPLLIVGVIALALRARRSPPARVALAALLLYPIGDALVAGTSAHALRSFVGVIALALVAAVGAAVVWEWLRLRSRTAALTCVTILALAAVGEHGNHLYRLFGEYNGRESVYRGYQADLVEACTWLRPRLSQADHIIVTPDKFNMPYMITLVTLGYEPQHWFAEPPQFVATGMWNQCISYGKFIFGYPGPGQAAIKAAFANRAGRRIYVVARPGTWASGVAENQIRDSFGRVQLLIQTTNDTHAGNPEPRTEAQ